MSKNERKSRMVVRTKTFLGSVHFQHSRRTKMKSKRRKKVTSNPILVTIPVMLAIYVARYLKTISTRA